MLPGLLLVLALFARCAHALQLRAGGKWASAARAFKANSLLYRENFVDDAVFQELREECRGLRRFFKRELDCIATGRMGCCVDARSLAHRGMTSPEISEALSSITGRTLVPSEFPVELRMYTTNAEMGWHQDDTLYVEPQVEVVLTLENTSDSETEWIDARGERHAQWMAPNSALIVSAGDEGPLHRVTPLRRGERTILKMAYTSTKEKCDGFDSHINSFPSANSKRTKKRR